jgi:3-deoxy-D-manno-octulosonic-acid transferase
MRTLYNILFTAFFILASPYYFFRMQRRGNWQRGFMQRFGRFDSKFKQAITNRQSIWLHAVSVGEVGVCTQLIRALEPRLPNLKIVVSTTTTTGMEELERRLPSHISRIYYPVDYRRCVSHALNTIHPEAIVLVEAEIWPNFIWKAKDMRIPLFLVNARLSERSFPRYKRLRFFFHRFFAAFTGVGAQNEADAAKLRQLGCRPDRIHVVGSLKFDSAPLDERRVVDVPGILRQLGVAAPAKILVAGSTHRGEEVLLAEQFIRLRKMFPDLFLILVPRHFERGREVGRELELRNIKFVYRTEISRSTQYGQNELECLLVNTTGELKHFYQAATVIFIGKSITAQGGQNPIEPGALGKPMVFGPNMQNFTDIVNSFLTKDGAVQVPNSAELEKALASLLGNPERCEQLGQNALAVVRENQGAIDRTVEMILKHLDAQEVYIAPK